ncbi:phage tail tube protein [Pararhizobium mangrovi]|uniref:Phage tail protein n=1 Tax=Pararhizobium mangrovi TaxID=2590452 RepID=A0A506TZ84_9HYPH|nr:phage tail tube protein [Pararhizobium mangrovi]TPW26035.1 hypothetical protein FJU11_16610 [Pararhizobium mangrovi]
MARTNKGRKFFIAVETEGGTKPVRKPTDLSQEEYEALAWTEVKHVGNIGQTGDDTNVVNYDELATEVTQKNKGITNAGDPTIECARTSSDPGQQAMRAAAKTGAYYAFKAVDKDAPEAGGTGSTYYNRGLVTGPMRPNGGNEDFILEQFKLGLVQSEIVVDPKPASGS